MALDKLVDSTQLNTDLTSIANAIRAKSGGSAALAFPAEFVSEIGNISGGGGWTADGIAQNLEPNGPIVLGDSVTEIAGQAFRQKPITSITGPNVTIVRSQSFYECSNLSDVYFPNAKTIGTEVFRGSGITSLTDTQFGAITTLNQASFGTMQALTRIFLAGFPAVLNANYVFDACTNLLTAVLPSTCTLTTGTFRGCTKLTAVDLGGNGSASIAVSTFQNSSVFNVLVLRNTTRTALSNINAFAGTPFASGKAGGTLYVPQALVSSYQSATNWSTILGYSTNQILPIEGSVYETQYVDSTLIT